MSLRRLAIPLLAALMLAVAACGSSTQDSTTSTSLSSGNPASVTVADIAGIPSAFLKYGKREGLFRKHGLKLNVSTAEGGAAIIPGVVSGSYDFGGANVMSVITGVAKGVPVKVVAPGTFERKEPANAFGGILVAPDSGIEKPADLAGKTIAVNTLDGIAELTVQISLANHGVKPSSVELAEIGFPNMLPALEQGRIDAAWEIEPFLTMGLNSGNKPLLWPYLETKPGMQVGSYTTSQQYLAKNPEVVEAFQAGIAGTAKAISSNPEKFRKALPELTELSSKAAQEMRLPRWRPDVDKATLQLITRKTAKYGHIDKKIAINEMLAPGAAS